MANNGYSQNVSMADTPMMSADARVNYAHGLVLGVNEFQQEQEYFLQKDYLHNMELHGFGVFSGLGVTADWLPGSEVQVTVEPGLALSPNGELIRVSGEQCARLAAWLAKWDADNPGQIADKIKNAPDGQLHVYVVVGYVDSLDAVVPVAGQPCSSNGVTAVPSRIRDAFDIQFCWDPPQELAWDAVRCFAKILAQVRIRPEAVDDSKEIIEQVRKLAQPENIPLCSSSSDGGGERREEEVEYWYLPADTAREALDSIFNVWVTEVRPNLQAEIGVGGGSSSTCDTGILLARIDFTLDDAYQLDTFRIAKFNKPDYADRPYLLHTQLIQELLLLGNRGLQRPIEGQARPEREFATLQVRNNHTLYAWIHHPDPLNLTAENQDWDDMLELRCDGQQLRIVNVAPVEVPDLVNVFEIRAERREPEAAMVATDQTVARAEPSQEDQTRATTPLAPGARVELIFKVRGISVQSEDEEEEEKEEEEEEEEEHPIKHLHEEIEEGEEKVEEEVKEGVHRVREEIHEAAEKVEGEIKEGIGEGERIIGKGVQEVGEEVREFGRAVSREIRGEGAEIRRAGAHVEREGKEIEKKGKETMRAGEKEEQEAKAEELKQKKEEQEEEEEEDRLSLRKSIRILGIDYVGYNREQHTITVYTIAEHIPTRELVTFFTYDYYADRQDPNVPHLALQAVAQEERFLAAWFHTDDPVKLPDQIVVQRAFINQEPESLVFRTAHDKDHPFSFFWALIPQAEQKDSTLIPGELLTVIFDTDAVLVGSPETSQSLTEVMKADQYTYVNYDGDHTVLAYHQASYPPSRYEGPPTPAHPFVTITRIANPEQRNSETDATFELWFHLTEDPTDDSARISDDLAFDIYLESNGSSRRGRHTKLEGHTTTAVHPNVFTTTVTLPEVEPGSNRQGYYLRFSFPLDKNPVIIRGADATKNLGEYIQRTGIRFEGYNGKDAIVSYVRIPVVKRETRR